ncbi:hypothetical protein [Numidum massiliense]|uniref:hypothetical protein n=1 Tax=Numidum massiliense TaxID=1522315 RepID=UPI0006D5A26D|nr:hypothetical protein [Numidum massiliense]
MINVLHVSKIESVPEENIVRNGGFETGALYPWRLKGSGAVEHRPIVHQMSGNYSFAFTTPAKDVTYLSQTLPLVKAGLYEVQGYLRRRGGTSKEMVFVASFYPSSMSLTGTTISTKFYTKFTMRVLSVASGRRMLTLGIYNNSAINAAHIDLDNVSMKKLEVD